MPRKANCLPAEIQKTFSVEFIQWHFNYSCSCWYAGRSQALQNNYKQHKTKQFILSTALAKRNCLV